MHAMPMPAQPWPAAAVSFLAMWMLMMAAMMLPSLIPMLGRYRAAARARGATRLGALTTLVGAGYLGVWGVMGVGICAATMALAAAEARLPALARAAPVAAGVVVLLGGALQLSSWKARHLACCRGAPVHGHALGLGARSAWQHGLRLGIHCCASCAGLTAVLIAVGMMDLRAMAAVTGAITAERLAPRGERVARVIGVLTVGVGWVLIARAVTPG